MKMFSALPRPPFLLPSFLLFSLPSSPWSYPDPFQEATLRTFPGLLSSQQEGHIPLFLPPNCQCGWLQWGNRKKAIGLKAFIPRSLFQDSRIWKIAFISYTNSYKIKYVVYLSAQRNWRILVLWEKRDIIIALEGSYCPRCEEYCCLTAHNI